LERNGDLTHVGRRKAVALLAYLAVTQQPHARDELAALLWPELDQPHARMMVRSVLLAISYALGKHCILLFDDQVEIACQSDLWVDVIHFRKLIASVAHCQCSPHDLCVECLDHLHEAVSLCQGHFLAGFSLADAPEFELWQTTEKEFLYHQFSAVLEQLAHNYVSGGRRQFGSAAEYARRWLALDPLHEPAHRMLMRLYACSGDRSAALEQYQECARTLQAELGVSPDAETSTLYEYIRGGGLPEFVETASREDKIRAW
jgi:DNA-binding SARP family transcriptional activator